MIPTLRTPRPDRHGAQSPAPPRRPALPALAAGAAALALAAAGCGSSGGGSSSSSSSSGSGGSSASGSSSSGGGATVAVKTEGTLGKILVDNQGRTLYLFEKDNGPTSTCYQACAGVWPPFTTSGKPKAGGGASGSQLATTQRKDGKTQAVYHGHPLYYYSPDAQQPGSTKGEGLKQFGAEWYVLSPAGAKVEQKGSGSSGSSSGGGGSSSGGASGGGY